jgi:soluble P-type ATPase
MDLDLELERREFVIVIGMVIGRLLLMRMLVGDLGMILLSEGRSEQRVLQRLFQSVLCGY